nr:immunoglobulin heavy chain junction region [Macaca mulatta]MOW87077.1 immunoglobulin heavy chain junction region [Macaca mulatta]MOW88500.1 immunoglobulin heavy chain junction region [Macaca mulatta]MOW89575.1 immunoglobulin heavy chain junction region [Macaca mulatta]MOW89742.1 immunoglobulin heavy chain junction region [Macaca mulatta]
CAKYGDGGNYFDSW